MLFKSRAYINNYNKLTVALINQHDYLIFLCCDINNGFTCAGEKDLVHTGAGVRRIEHNHCVLPAGVQGGACEGAETLRGKRSCGCVEGVTLSTYFVCRFVKLVDDMFELLRLPGTWNKYYAHRVATVKDERWKGIRLLYRMRR